MSAMKYSLKSAIDPKKIICQDYHERVSRGQEFIMHLESLGSGNAFLFGIHFKSEKFQSS